MYCFGELEQCSKINKIEKLRKLQLQQKSINH